MTPGFCGIEVAMTCGRVLLGVVPELWSKPLWEKVWPFLDAWDSVRLRTASTQWNIPGKLFDSEEAGICARQRGLQLFHLGWLSSPRVDGQK